MKRVFIARLYYNSKKVGGLSDLELLDLIVIAIFGGGRYYPFAAWAGNNDYHRTSVGMEEIKRG